MNFRKITAFVSAFLFISSFVSAKSKSPTLKEKIFNEPENLSVFRLAYPDVTFEPSFDKDKNDWLITVTSSFSKISRKLYWCEGRFLPEEKLSEKDHYRKMLYSYPEKTPDPEDFTPEDIEAIKAFSSKENRTKGPVDPPFLYNVIYDIENRTSTETHIKTYYFFGNEKTVNVHERIFSPLRRASNRVMELQKTPELEKFFSTLTRTDGFNWRQVRDTESRSFHSAGLAVDILPKGYYQKFIYWGWQKQWDPDGWYMTPLDQRWMPPESVIKIFEEEGFIWGGKWAVWDNMHFEYHPEILIYNKMLKRAVL